MLQSLRKKRIEAIEFVKKLNAKDSLTEAENKELETRWNEAKALEKRISIYEQQEKESLSKQPIMEPKAKPKYSLYRAIKCLWEGKSGLEGETHKELENRGATSSGNGLLVPTAELFGAPPQAKEQRIVDGQAALVDDGVREDLRVTALYERSIAKMLGIKFISATGNFRFPTGNKVTAGWITGDGGSSANDKLSEQDSEWMSTSVTPHFLGAITGWSLKLLKETAGSVSVESLIRENLLAGLSEKFDDAVLNATNVSPQPQGFNVWLGTQNLTNKTESSASKWAYSDFTGEVKELRDQYKNNAMSPIWLMGSKDEKLLKEVQRFSSSDGESILQSIGPVVVSGHVPATRLWLGQWSEFMVTMFDSAEVQLGMIDDDFQKGVQRLRVILCADFTGIRKSGFRGFNITRG